MADKSNISFTKMEGAGNDFIVIDNRNHRFQIREFKQLAPVLCDRKFGIGADGILALADPEIEGLDFTMIYRNSDGSDAGMCGNGARCIAKYASDRGMGDILRFNVHEHVYEAEVLDRSRVKVSFPLKTGIRRIELNSRDICQVYAGTEHIVLEKEENELKEESHIEKEGRALRQNELFQPLGTNVNFICGVSPDELKLQTYERGVEEITLACGTGAIASALAWHHLQDSEKRENSIAVHTVGGELKVNFKYNPDTDTYLDIELFGEAHTVFEGTYVL